ncbi:hypothetical protein TanjilG_05218 [Lupinus angustifolius]|uniref:RRM domain-containing protein n=1 Tax=Lupinus angustifolius TaxID=3871 RepID=A0A4P1RAK0_LUPAN|nr:PREDICTED: uncharacterized protein LOC109355161 [Lupinus angustifolius]XP_019453684.1 PREDICTED: uncharacterized protein LOC109355161 [Lupinus angustifolius]OIW06447.1 hypothetical protein TanjilG_05218 [Lupinus angustifolius]
MSGVVRAALRYKSSVSASFQRGFVIPISSQNLVSCFSTESQKPPSQDSTASPPPPPFNQSDTSGLIYGRLLGIHRHILKTDVIHFLDGSNLTLDDVKMDYNRSFLPLGMMLQFPSRNAYDNALRALVRNGRFYKLERADRSQWDTVTPYDGKTILIKGIPRNAQFDDIEHILSGSEYDQSSINIFMRSDGYEPVRMATVRYPSRTQAMNAFITKNGTFCLNNRVSVQVLQ